MGGWVGKQLARIDPGKSIGRTLAKIDPGPAIGRTLAQVDKTVNDNIPGGWATVGAGALLAVGITNPSLLGMANSGTLSSSALSTAGYSPSAIAGISSKISTAYASAITNVAATTGLSEAVIAAAAKGSLIGGLGQGGIAAIRGKNVFEATLKGLVTGAVTGGAGSAIGSAVQGADFVNTIASATGISAGTVAGAIGGMATGAIGGGVTSALNGGQDFLRNTLIGAGIGGVTGGIFGPMGNAPVDPEDLAFQTADAANLASQGIGANQIKDILQISYGIDAGTAAALASAAVANPQPLPSVLDEAIASAEPTDINPATGRPWSETGSGFAGNGEYFEDFVPATVAPAAPVDDIIAPVDDIASDINPATGRPWSETGSGFAGNGTNPNMTIDPETGVPIYDNSQAADAATQMAADQSWYQKVPDLISNAGAFLPSAGTALGALAAGSLIAPMIFRPQQPPPPDQSYGPIAPINWGSATSLVNPGTNPGFTPAIQYAPFGRGQAQPLFDPNAFTQKIMQPQEQAAAMGATVPYAQLQPYVFEPKTAADYTPAKIFGPSGQPTGFTG